MVFDHRSDRDYLELYSDRYSTADDARSGHAEAVAWVKAGNATQKADQRAEERKEWDS